MADSYSTDPRLVIAQAIFDPTRLTARCPHFLDEWTPEALRLVAGWGTPPAGVECPEAMFAYPFGSKHFAVVTVSGPPHFSVYRFRFLIVTKPLYDLLHDPFLIAERYVPHWYASSALTPLEWALEPVLPRSVAQLDEVLKQGYGPLLLGGTQVLVDSGKLALQRDAPDSKLPRDIWMLLPDAVRRIVRPATFAFSLELGFDLAMLPTLPDPLPPGYLNEEQASEYPTSRYEISLQTAVESGDQREVTRLLSRRTTKEMMRLMLWIIVGMTVIAYAMRFVVK